MIAAVVVSAIPFSGAIGSTGMIIWAAVGLAGLTGGMVTVGSARRRRRLSEPATAENVQPVTADSLTDAA